MSKVYHCPRCNSPEVYAGAKLIDKVFKVIHIFAGCRDCNYQAVKTGTIK